MPIDSRPIYSTENGGVCPKCGADLRKCACANPTTATKADGIVRVGRETKGRKGAGVTVISGVPRTGNDLTDLATRLKKRCGSGGTIRDGIIEIQGDHRDLLVEELKKEGWTVKRVGG